MRLIPAIDLRGGRCVRLLQGDFDAETVYAPAAPELLEKYRRIGADWLHVVDLDGARDGSGANRAIIRELARPAADRSCRSAAACATGPRSPRCSTSASRAPSSAARR